MQITILSSTEAADSLPESSVQPLSPNSNTNPDAASAPSTIMAQQPHDHDEHATMTIDVEETNRKYASISPAPNSLKRLAPDSDSASNTGSNTDGTASLPSTEPSTTPDEISSSSGASANGRLARNPSKRTRTSSSEPSASIMRERAQLPHPLGIKPLGNAFLSDRNDRIPSLGLFARFDDEFLLNFLVTFADDPATLAKLEAVSHGLYTFINATNAIWREAFLLAFNGKMKRWCGSWKRTFIWHRKLHRAVFDDKARDSMDGSGFALLEPPAPRIQSPFLFSDTLYHPFRLASAPLDHLVAPACRVYNRIPKIDLAEPGAMASFKQDFAYANKPAIVQNAMPPKDWPCREWSLDKLAQRWPTRFFQCEAVRSRLPTYFSYSRGMQHLYDQTWQQLLEQDNGDHDSARQRASPSASNEATPSEENDSPRDRTALPLQDTPYTVTRAASHLFSAAADEGDSTFDPHAVPDESPFYMFDASFADDPHASLEWRVPKFFQQISTTAADARADHDASAVRSDLFALLGRLRPDHRWIIAGPARSGSGWHKDPNATSAWNAVLTGRKAWMMLPPHVTPPGVYVSDDEAEVTAPLSIAEWLLDFAQETRRLYGPSAERAEDRLLVEGVCEEGEVLYVPSGWWHLVINLEESVALTQNFVSPPELATVLDFMKNKSDQLSGFKRTQGEGAVALAPGRQAASICQAALTSQADEADDDCDGATFDVFALFTDRLRRFDPELLDEALEKVARLEQERRESCLARRLGPAPRSATARKANANGPSWWEKLKHQDAPLTADGQADKVEAQVAAFSFSTQLASADLELDEVPW